MHQASSSFISQYEVFTISLALCVDWTAFQKKKKMKVRENENKY